MMLKSHFSEPLNRFRRAQIHRQDAQELENKGYDSLALMNREMADYLDPPKRYEPEFDLE